MPIYDGTKPVEETTYLTDEFTNRTVRFIERHKDEPFFLYLAYNAKHTPLQAPENYLQRNQGDINAAMIDAMDTGVGRVLDTLEKDRLGANTMVWFVGDNGGWPAPNWRLRGRKGTFFEGGLRVPFLLSWPRALPARQVYREPVMHIDLLPTILAAVGAASPSDRDIDGVNLLPFLQGRVSNSPHEVIFWGRPAGQRKRFAVRRSRWKLTCNADSPNKAAQLGEDRFGLFDLQNDASEQNNRFREERGVADELCALAEQWHQRMSRRKAARK
jgi:arylsulfatase A-like enzyme